MTGPIVAEPAQGNGPGRSATTARNSVIVSVWTLVSRLTGLLRVVVIGAVMGPTFFANIFQAGYVVPNLVYSAIAGPVLAMVLVPALVRAIGAGGVQHGSHVFGRVCGCLLTLACALAVLIVVLSPLIAWTLTFGIPDPRGRARALELTTILVLFVAPQVPLFTLAGLGAAAQQARGRFALAAGAGAVENVALIVTVIGTGLVFGTGLEVDRAPVQMVVLLGVGSTLAVAAHAALQLFGAARGGVLAAPVWRWWRDPEARAFARRMSRSFGVAACPAVAMYVLFVMAGTVPGGVLVIQLAYSVFYGLSYLGARAVSIAALPGLAAAVDRANPAAFASAWRQGLTYAVAASLPMLCLLAVFATPAAQLLARGEMRTSSVIGQLAACLVVVAVAQLIGGLHDLGRQALFAQLDERGPRLAGMVALVVSLVVASAAMVLPVGGGRLVSLTLAILAGELAAAVTVLTRLRRTIGRKRMINPSALAMPVIAAVAMLPVALAGLWAQSALPAGRAVQLVLLAAGVLVAAGVYVAALRGRLGRDIGETP
ncbi:MAG: murein biosynthesis integral membrane protein MurJ [Pseudonocardiaceae bacterium]